MCWWRTRPGGSSDPYGAKGARRIGGLFAEGRKERWASTEAYRSHLGLSACQALADRKPAGQGRRRRRSATRALARALDARATGRPFVPPSA